jgi:hypothetical protein
MSTLTSPPVAPVDLIREWRSQAAQYERDGMVPAARLLARVADELESIAGGETVTLAEAARRTGYSADHLRRLVQAGHLRNIGRKHAPRFLARDLPIKGQRFRMSGNADILNGQSRDG